MGKFLFCEPTHWPRHSRDEDARPPRDTTSGRQPVTRAVDDGLAEHLGAGQCPWPEPSRAITGRCSSRQAAGFRVGPRSLCVLVDVCPLSCWVVVRGIRSTSQAASHGDNERERERKVRAADEAELGEPNPGTHPRQALLDPVAERKRVGARARRHRRQGQLRMPSGHVATAANPVGGRAKRPFQAGGREKSRPAGFSGL